MMTKTLATFVVLAMIINCVAVLAHDDEVLKFKVEFDKDLASAADIATLDTNIEVAKTDKIQVVLEWARRNLNIKGDIGVGCSFVGFNPKDTFEQSAEKLQSCHGKLHISKLHVGC